VPNVLMVIPASLYRELPIELRERLIESATLVGIGETPALWRIDKTRDAAVPDHLTSDDLAPFLTTGVE
jgi:hypothetical protein